MNSSLKILLVEDNPGDVAILEHMLAETGRRYELISAERLAAAIGLVTTDSFDAILLDLGLPDSYGLDTLLKLIVFTPTVPVIVLTGLADEVVGREAVKAGAQDFLVKGELDSNLLARSINHAIDRLRLDAEIKAAAAEWSASFDAMVDGVSIHSADYTILNVNKALLELFGLQKSEIVGRKCHQLFHGYDCPVAGCPISETLQTKKQAYFECFEPKLNKWLAVSTSPILDASGSTSRIVHTVRDITENRKLEMQLRQSQKMESIGTLAGGIAHDFNNILTIINGYGTLALMKVAEDDPLHLFIRNILDAAERAADLTRDLLLFSRKRSAERAPVDVNTLIERNGRFLRRVISEDIAYEARIGREPLMVTVNEHQLDQVLLNMATNARDAMPRGGKLTVTAAEFTMDSRFIFENGFGQPGTYALLTIADSGIGMDSDTRQHIFEPFFTTKDVDKGTGLGLAVVYGIIKQHDGFISVESEPDRGTTFSIYLPLTTDSGQEVPADQNDAADLGGTETILLAEDDERVRLMTSQILNGSGYTVIEAVDGQDAVSKFVACSGAVDLLLFDLIMPKMNGKEAFEKIRQLQPGIKGAFLSGYAPETIREKVLLTDDVYLLSKPIAPRELLRMVRSILQR